MNYEQEIKAILYEAGNEGLSVRKLARHIFNIHNGLFESTPYEEVYKSIQTCIAKNNKSSRPFLKKAKRWGYYRLTEAAQDCTQLQLQFNDQEDKHCNDKKETPDTDMLPSLFKEQ